MPMEDEFLQQRAGCGAGVSAKPLVVDLDGTLIHTDMLCESALKVFKHSPVEILRVPFVLWKGKAFLKQYLASKSDPDPKTLPYNEELLEWLTQQRAEGRRLVLCTASDRKIADLIAGHVGIFNEVIASDGVLNIAGENKAAALVERFGLRGYDYVGNSYKDLPVWSQADKAVVVNGSSDLVKKAQNIATVERVFPAKPIGFSSWRRVFRIHQWLKNILLFVPLLAAYDFGNLHAWQALILGFASFSLCASSVYIVNDLLDLESDRLHPRKRNRPFASGTVSVWTGVLIAPLLLIISLIVAALVGQQFLLCLIFYFCLTCAYSYVLKRLVLIDCITLAMLYTLRVISGAAAIGQHNISFWMLAFSVFLFLSLAFLKRYAELEVQALGGKEKIHGRGYHTADASLVQTMGIVSGYLSSLVLILYLDSETARGLYAIPNLIWGAVPVMLFWISWMWLQAHRGKMHDDPIVFAIKDRASLAAGVAFSVILLAGARGGVW